MVELRMMMIFIGTEYQGGRQFHVWLNSNGTTEDLIEAISIHESLPSSSFIIQHSYIPLNPFISLTEQGIQEYSIIHLYLLSDLRSKELQRKENLKQEYEERGRYVDKKGKLKLRRRTRKNLQKRKLELEREKRGNGLLPRFREFELVAKEFVVGEENRLESLSIPSSTSSNQTSKPSFPQQHHHPHHHHQQDELRRKKQKSLLTSTPLSRNSNKQDNWINSSISPTIPSSSSSNPNPIRSIIPIPLSSNSSITFHSSSPYTFSTNPSPSPASSISVTPSHSRYYREVTPTLPQYPRTLSPKRPWED